MGVAGDVVEGLLVGAVGGPQPGRGGRVGVGGFGEPGPQEMVVGVGEQQRAGQAGVGDLVAAGPGHPVDEPVGVEPPQVVGHHPGGDVLGCLAEQGRNQGAQVTVGEAVR